NIYSFRDVFAGRLLLSKANLEAYTEYAVSKHYRKADGVTEGSAIYANADYMFGPLQLGGAYKHYDNFSYRLQDLPLANYHAETLSDALASGIDEEGWQARALLNLGYAWSLSADYAEAWDSPKDK